MESILWAFDLVAVVLLCRWAVAQDKQASAQKTGKRLG
jgi:hypothetical protein